ncbi:MAG: hypothetical protein HZA91_00275 [Verrucomicrobia bacterium]|nr:hypothetical protein [Verrucomicrobiota bacterium]
MIPGAITVCHAARLGRPLKWDPAREVFPDDPQANRFLSRAARESWLI